MLLCCIILIQLVSGLLEKIASIFFGRSPTREKRVVSGSLLYTTWKNVVCRCRSFSR